MLVEKITKEELLSRIVQTKSDIDENKKLMKELENEKNEIIEYQDLIAGNVLRDEFNLFRLKQLAKRK